MAAGIAIAVSGATGTGKTTLLNVRELQEFDRRCMDVACGTCGRAQVRPPTSSVWLSGGG